MHIIFYGLYGIIYQEVQRKMVLVVNFILFFGNCFCFVFAMSDQVHDLEAMHRPC